jgi:hypothetical protein
MSLNVKCSSTRRCRVYVEAMYTIIQYKNATVRAEHSLSAAVHVATCDRLASKGLVTASSYSFCISSLVTVL